MEGITERCHSRARPSNLVTSIRRFVSGHTVRSPHFFGIHQLHQKLYAKRIETQMRKDSTTNGKYFSSSRMKHINDLKKINN